MRRTLLLIFIFLSVALTAAGRDSLYHNVSLAVSAGYNLPTHGFYRGYNEAGVPLPANSSAHLKYSFGFQPNTRLGTLYPGVTQGIGVAGLTFYNHDLMGSPAFAYIFQNARLFDVASNLGLDFGWEFGGSYGWKRNQIIQSRANIYVNVCLMLAWDMTDRWTLTFGPEFSHFSNGDTRFPNGGANFTNLKVGITGHVVPQNNESYTNAAVEYESQLREKTFAQRMEYDLILFGGWRAAKVKTEIHALINEPFPVFGMNFMPSYRINRYFSAGASLDILADRSANLYDIVKDPATREVIDYKQPSLDNQVAAGLSVRGEITMPIFAVGAGFGGFVLPNGDSLKGFYTTFTLKTFMTEQMFLYISYRLSAINYNHNMMYGLGWRF